MLSLNGFPGPVLPNVPLPHPAQQAVHDAIVRRGFAAQAILQDYRYSISPNQYIQANALVFAHPIHRTPADYAGITVYNATGGLPDEDIVPLLARSAAPLHLIHRGERFSFWGSAVTGNSNQPIQPVHFQSDLTYDQLDSTLRIYDMDLKPQRIVDVKQGRDQFIHPAFRQLQPLQLSLWTEDVTKDLLATHFGLAVDTLRTYTGPGESPVPPNVDTLIAIQLLGASILADTGVLGDAARRNDISWRDLLTAAASQFPRYFRLTNLDSFSAATESAYRVLRRISYAGFTPGMLTRLFAQAYSPTMRKQLGAYDTPLYLTRRILDNLPIEYLPPDQRVVADMTCGWGSFLIAGYERLSRLRDMPDRPLRDFLFGNDMVDFTAQLAGLGLLVSTSQDRWNITNEDAITWNWLNTNRPNIIVGNPPFSGNRKSASQDIQKRVQEADKFLSRAIDRLAPGGYLALLMPQSFVSAEASPLLREELLRECDVQELWEMPLQVFEARAASVVLFARKRENVGQNLGMPVRVRTVQSRTLDAFKDIQTRLFTASGIATDQSKWNQESRRMTKKRPKNTHIMDYHLTLPEPVWQSIQSHTISLYEVTVVLPGIIKGRQGKWRDYQHPKKIRWLVNAKKTIQRPFFIDQFASAQEANYPNDFERPRMHELDENDMEPYLAGKKVLMTANQNPSWGTRVRVAIERQGYYPSDGFWILVPKTDAEHSGITHEVIAAVVSWKVSNAWIIDHLKHTKIPARALETVPFPKQIDGEACRMLTEAVWALEEAANTGASARKAQRTIDTILTAAYGLDNTTFERLCIIADWDTNPRITLDATAPSTAKWHISGVVESVDATQNTVTLWLEGFTELESVPIDAKMPGWMLRPGAAFRTVIPRVFVRRRSLKGVTWGSFFPQHYTYMSEEALFDDMTTFFSSTAIG